ncbi:mid region of cactin-domain-containing protein [Gongronella butleri]|nr:mid region of cactin-domain-containing protein [Gongronella butleri]
MASSPDRSRGRSRHDDDRDHDRKRRHRSPDDDDRRRRRHRSRSRDDERRKHKDKKEKKKKRDRRDHDDRDQDADLVPAARPSLDQLGYSNVNNPFNDINLESKFVWAKKKERDRQELGLKSSDIKQREEARRREADLELAKLNKRRAERDEERRLREEEMERKQREAELAQMGDWQAKEEDFHLEQAKRRAEIRIKEGRAKPIDILAMNLRLANEADQMDDEVDLEIDLDEPYKIFDDLSLADTEELDEDIQMHLLLEKNRDSLAFWKAMVVVSQDRLEKLHASEEQRAMGGVVAEVNTDIQRVLEGKTYDQLSQLQKQVRAKLDSGEPIDVEYWETLLRELIVYKAKAKLSRMHQDMLTRRLDQLRERQRQEAHKVQHELDQVLSMQAADVSGQGVGPGEGIAAEPVDQDLTETQDIKAFGQNGPSGAPASVQTYTRSMSPEPLAQLPKSEQMLLVLDPVDDMKQLIEQRRQVLATKIIPIKPRMARDTEPAKEDDHDASMASSALFEKERAQGFDEDESLFNIEAELSKQTYMWQDKYRPRKPRYFNRVHTGYEWNKYNQTHYDFDNPPPKVVQGYKFNIFYPDLIDKTKTPTYRIERDPETPDTVMIRFIAGPPYEDIAFRIVNREWEYSHKKGFKCTFDRGVLSLWFHFKRQFYRK